MRVLLDECVPAQIRFELAGHDIETVSRTDWQGKKKGMVPQNKKRLPPGERVVLKLNSRERELILEHTSRAGELTDRLHFARGPADESTAYGFTLDDLDELASYVAAEANHTKNTKLQRALDRLYAKIAAVLDSFVDGN